jgi:hypothetical protein
MFDCFLRLIAHLNAVNLFSFTKGKIHKKRSIATQFRKVIWKMEEKHKVYREKLLVIKRNCSIRKHSYICQAFITIASTYAFHGAHLASLVDLESHTQEDREGRCRKR